jgi:hypothetical protein
VSSVFPGAIDDFDTSMLPGGPMSVPSHAAQHQKIGDALEKIETRLGTGGAPASVLAAPSGPGTSLGTRVIQTIAALNLTIGMRVATGVGTSKCEIRRVTGTAAGGTQVTLNQDLNLVHSAGEQVYILAMPYAPLDWWDAASQGYTGIMGALIDVAETGASIYGLSGQPEAGYYSSYPLSIPDYATLFHVWLAANVPFGIDCTIGKFGNFYSNTVGTMPGQDFITCAGQFGHVLSVDATTDTISLDGDPGGPPGFSGTKGPIQFHPRPGSTLPAGLEPGRIYWVKTMATVGYPHTQVTLSLDQFGSTTVNITDAGTGSFVWFSMGQTRARMFFCRFSGGNVRGLNGVNIATNQPSHIFGCRIQYFPGPRGGLIYGSQEGQIFGFMITDCGAGVRMAGHLLYLYGGNIERCFKHIILDDVDGNGDNGFIGQNGVSNVIVDGLHSEAADQGTGDHRYIVGNASVSGGTYTLTVQMPGQGTETTGAIAYNASAATVQTALEALTQFVPGDVTVQIYAGTGALPGGELEIIIAGQYKWMNLRNARLDINTGSLVGGSYVIVLTDPDSADISQIAGQGVTVKQRVADRVRLGLLPARKHPRRRLAATYDTQVGITLEAIGAYAGG